MPALRGFEPRIASRTRQSKQRNLVALVAKPLLNPLWTNFQPSESTTTSRVLFVIEDSQTFSHTGVLLVTSLQDAKKTEAEKELIREQMAKHEVELNTQFEQFQKEKAERKTLAKRLKAMEDKLVVGGKEVNVEQLQQQRNERQEELARQKVRLLLYYSCLLTLRSVSTNQT